MLFAGGAGGAAPPSPNPHPAFPAWVVAPRPEQTPKFWPVTKAQHAVVAQSSEFLHSAPMNWMCPPLPTFLAPDGSGVMGRGVARAERATVRMC